MILKKSFYEYDNFREFLRDYYAQAKAEDKKFSLGFFSKMAGFKSRSVLRQVMAGERNIAVHSIEKFVKALKLNKTEAFFFRNLVMLNQAASSEEKARYAQEIMKSKSYRDANPLKESQFNYFRKWYFVVIRELAALPGFKDDPQWIASQVKPAITVHEAEEAVRELTKLGFLTRESDGALRPSEGWLSTADEVTSAAITQFHKDMLKKAAESIERFPREKRDISAQTFAASEKAAKIVKEMIQNFRKEVEKALSNDHGQDAVYQLNFQLFPVAAPNDRKTE